jgi:hypothetical protein
VRRVHRIALGLVLATLLLLDRTLAPDGEKGSEYGLLQRQARRLEGERNASVLVLGQSTTGQWLTPRNLGKILRRPARSVLDGHLSGCHPDCSYAEVRKLVADGRHFRETFFGVNLFTLCEGEARRRVASELLTLPLEDTWLMARHYWHAEQPTEFLGSMAALLVSHGYRDPEFVQRRVFGELMSPRGKPSLWIEQRRVDAIANRGRHPKKKPQPDRSCSLEPEDIGFKMSVLDALIADLSALSDHTYLLALPDRTLRDRSSNPEMARRWTRFVTLLREVAASRPGVELLDLATDGPSKSSHYRDSFHLSPAGIRYQNRALKRALRKSRGPKRSRR